MAETLTTKLDVVHRIGLEIDTTPAGAARNYVSFGTGFDNMSEELNETVQQYFFLNDGGYARNFVTGIAPIITVTGVRIIGDPAQDFIFAFDHKYGLLETRDTTLRITRRTGDGNSITCVVPITLCNVSDISGATTDGCAVSVEMRFNGKPTIEVAEAAEVSEQTE